MGDSAGLAITENTASKKSVKTVMSGMRPTGRLHIGHYFGVLKNWVELQAEHNCYFMVADWHALTTKYRDTAGIADDTLEMVIDWLAAGVNPEKAVLYVQSTIPEIAELHLLLSMLTPVPWVQGDPTLKDMVKLLSDDLNYGLLGYPVLQTADVLTMLGDCVPVGKDQVAHLEISRDLARRFNHIYKTELLPEPQPLLTDIPVLLGLDGAKMSKSLGNTILLADTAEQTVKKLRKAMTDPGRVRREDAGSPQACSVVYKYYELFASKESTENAATECRVASRGCVDCKDELAEYVNAELQEVRARRALYADDKAQVQEILRSGNERARYQAVKTLDKVRRAMKMPTRPKAAKSKVLQQAAAHIKLNQAAGKPFVAHELRQQFKLENDDVLRVLTSVINAGLS